MDKTADVFKDLQEIIQHLLDLLKTETEIDEIQYCKAVGDFSKELKILLNRYFESDDEGRDNLRPFINYYRQLQHYLVFLVMNSEILKVPSHSEIIQTIVFMEGQERLIRNVYVDFSKAQKQLFSSQFKEILDKLLELRLLQMKKDDSSDQ